MSKSFNSEKLPVMGAAKTARVYRQLDTTALAEMRLPAMPGPRPPALVLQSRLSFSMWEYLQPALPPSRSLTAAKAQLPTEEPDDTMRNDLPRKIQIHSGLFQAGP